jgi:hypothetical protein
MVSPIGHAILLPSHFAVGKERAGVYLRWGGCRNTTDLKSERGQERDILDLMEHGFKVDGVSRNRLERETAGGIYTVRSARKYGNFRRPIFVFRASVRPESLPMVSFCAIEVGKPERMKMV